MSNKGKSKEARKKMEQADDWNELITAAKDYIDPDIVKAIEFVRRYTIQPAPLLEVQTVCEGACDASKK